MVRAIIGNTFPHRDGILNFTFPNSRHLNFTIADELTGTCIKLPNKNLYPFPALLSARAGIACDIVFRVAATRVMHLAVSYMQLRARYVSMRISTDHCQFLLRRLKHINRQGIYLPNVS